MTTHLSCAPVSSGLNRGGSKVKVKGWMMGVDGKKCVANLQREVSF